MFNYMFVPIYLARLLFLANCKVYIYIYIYIYIYMYVKCIQGACTAQSTVKCSDFP